MPSADPRARPVALWLVAKTGRALGAASAVPVAYSRSQAVLPKRSHPWSSASSPIASTTLYQPLIGA